MSVQKLLPKGPLQVLDLGYNTKPSSLPYSSDVDLRGDSHDFCYVSKIQTGPISQRTSYILITGQSTPEKEIEYKWCKYTCLFIWFLTKEWKSRAEDMKDTNGMLNIRKANLKASYFLIARLTWS